MEVWRSVRTGGDTKTRKSRRSLALPQRAIDALTAHRTAQDTADQAAGKRWQDHGLVFPTRYGTPQDDANVRRDFRRVIAAAGLAATEWTPRELRHSFVLLLSEDGMSIERISRLVGPSGTSVTELIYRKQIRPVVESGAVTMDRLFPPATETGCHSHSVSHSKINQAPSGPQWTGPDLRAASGNRTRIASLEIGHGSWS